jgi:PIN domain nuclease of toxin-antitoxin system
MLLSPGKFIRYCEMAGYRNLPVFDDHIRMLSTIPDIEELRHHDPFDRVLLAQAKAENMLFLTHDSLLARYDEACIVAV